MGNVRDLYCDCQRMSWTVADWAPGRHICCYCRDCQSFAHHLGHGQVLTPQGGTQIFQTVPAHMAFYSSLSALRALRLTDKGLIRWYTGCCNTPIANTMAKPDLPFVGMILRPPAEAYGPVKAHVNTDAAKGRVTSSGLIGAGATVLTRGLMAIGTSKTQSPFFDDAGRPVVEPQVLTQAERKAAIRASL